MDVSLAGRVAAEPLLITVKRACELSSLGPSTVWTFIRDGRLQVVRVPGVRRTLITYSSLARLLAPPPAAPRRRRGRPRKVEVNEATA
jgi:hypothetical protein